MAALLGPFELQSRIARGGMGEVWRAVHREQRIPVAVKLLTGQGTDEARRATRREVRAAAGLDHPNVVRVYDVGEVAPGGPWWSQLGGGAQWIAMELVEGTSAAPLRGELRWSQLRALLLGTLDGLAHAHAHGVIHRDLKPGNVLVDPHGRVKLTDFGIAHTMGTLPDEPAAMGTPAYMAPEQFEASWRDYGPWTDLYALGSLGWALAAGDPPWKRGNWLATVQAQRLGSLPPFTPRHPMPAGFEEWLATLLRAAPPARFQRAADAAWALSRLEAVAPDPKTAVHRREAPGHADSEAPRSERSGAERAQASRSSPDTTTVRLAPGEAPPPEPAGEGPHDPPPGGLAPPPPPPTLPASWRREGAPRRAPDLAGAGLGLYGLRAIRLVGREREQDALWEALAAARAGKPHLVAIRGSAGLGKSRLAEWLTHRAHEVGAVTVLRAGHSPDGGPADGLAVGVARHLGCQGLSTADVLLRLRRTFAGGADPVAELEALAEMIRPSGGGEGAVRLGRAERLAVIRRLLVRLCAHRPVLVWIDDAQWGLDALELAASVLDLAPTLPVLFVATLREEALEPGSEAHGLVRALLARPGVVDLELRPLDAAARVDLIRELLLLDDALARQVAEQSGGSPLFAVQLVGEWVARGLLAPTSSGFTLRAERPSVPGDLDQVWGARREQVLAGLPPGAGRLLELAACLGMEVDDEEWRRVARVAGVSPDPELGERLLDSRLARPLAGTADWAFVHEGFRDSLLRLAELRGHLAELHAACAEALVGHPGTAGRAGRHLLAAGRPLDAIAPLTRAAEDASRLGEIREAAALHLLHVEALTRSGLPEGDPRWGWAWARCAEIARARGDMAGAAAWSERVLAHADRPGWERASLDARWILAWLRVKVDQAEGLALFSALLPDYERADLPAFEVRTLVMMAVTHQFLGDLERSRVCAEEAVARVPRIPPGDANRGEAFRVLGAVRLQQGQLDDASAQFSRAVDEFERAGNRAGRALAVVGLGDVARFRGQLDEAEVIYTEVQQRLEAVGAGASRTIRPNLALIWLGRGRYAEALALLDEVTGSLDARVHHLERGMFGWLKLPCYAALGRWEAFDEQLDGPPPPVDADLAAAIEKAGRLAHAAGEGGRGDRARSLARHQWRLLGRMEGG